MPNNRGPEFRNFEVCVRIHSVPAQMPSERAQRRWQMTSIEDFSFTVIRTLWRFGMGAAVGLLVGGPVGLVVGGTTVGALSEIEEFRRLRLNSVRNAKIERETTTCCMGHVHSITTGEFLAGTMFRPKRPLLQKIVW